MAKKKNIPQYGTTTIKGHTYYRTRIADADGKYVSLYATTREELYKKQLEAQRKVANIIYHRENPTVSEYCEKWLLMHSAKVSKQTLQGYRSYMQKYVMDPLGDRLIQDITTDDIRLAMVPLSQKSVNAYNLVNMLVKSVFKSAERSQVISYNPCVGISPRGGCPQRKKNPLTDQQAQALLEAIRGLPPYLFVMIGLYAGLRREEILGLQWDCVFLDAPTPYISVRRAWRSYNKNTEISTMLKSKAAKRDIPIPQCLVKCLMEARSSATTEYVFANQKGQPLTASQFSSLWRPVSIRTTPASKAANVSCQPVLYPAAHRPGTSRRARTSGAVILDFHVSPHLLRHTYITNLIHAGVDPKTVQYLAGHENSKTTMDIYAKVKYNQPEILHSVINNAFAQTVPDSGSSLTPWVKSHANGP